MFPFLAKSSLILGAKPGDQKVAKGARTGTWVGLQGGRLVILLSLNSGQMAWLPAALDLSCEQLGASGVEASAQAQRLI